LLAGVLVLGVPMGAWADRQFPVPNPNDELRVCSPTGALIASVDDDGVVVLRSATDPSKALRRLWVYGIKDEGPTTGITFSPQGDFVVTTSQRGDARLWSTKAPFRDRKFMVAGVKEDGPITGVTTSTRGDFVYTTSRKGVVREWSTGTGPFGRQIRQP
jgi:WD40 repeat protein